MAAETFKETMDEVRTEIENEESQATAAEQENSQETPEAQEENAKLAELDADDEFNKSVPTEFNKDKRWRQIYRRMKEAERSKSELQEQLDELSNKEEPPQELDDDTLTKLAQKRGYQLTRAEKKELTKLQDFLNKVEKPDEREWLNKYSEALKNELMDSFAKKYDLPLTEMNKVVTDYRLDKSEQKARKWIEGLNSKYGIKIDFEKDVDPALEKMIRKLQKDPTFNPYSTDIYKLTREWFAENGIEYGKQLSFRQQQKLNEEKKKANAETSSITSAQKPKDDLNKSAKEIMKEVEQEMGFMR